MLINIKGPFTGKGGGRRRRRLAGIKWRGGEGHVEKGGN